MTSSSAAPSPAASGRGASRSRTARRKNTCAPCAVLHARCRLRSAICRRTADIWRRTIAAFGFASEPEPGVLAIDMAAVEGVHLVKLTPDGRKIQGGADNPSKITVGLDIAVRRHRRPGANDLLGLAITEGIEDGLTAYAATGLGVWAACTAGRMPALADAVPDYIEAVTIFAHPDPAGQRGAVALADTLDARGIEVRMIEPSFKIIAKSDDELLDYLRRSK